MGIAHIFGQVRPGPNTNIPAAERALSDFAKSYNTLEDQPLYAPYMMGCGRGGGDWNVYSALIEKYLPQTTIIRLPSSY